MEINVFLEESLPPMSSTEEIPPRRSSCRELLIEITDLLEGVLAPELPIEEVHAGRRYWTGFLSKPMVSLRLKATIS